MIEKIKDNLGALAATLITLTTVIGISAGAWSSINSTFQTVESSKIQNYNIQMSLNSIKIRWWDNYIATTELNPAEQRSYDQLIDSSAKTKCAYNKLLGMVQECD